MSAVRGKRKPSEAELTDYEKEKQANILRNQKRMQDLNIPTILQELDSLQPAQRRQRKPTDHTRAEGSEAGIGRNLRSSSRVSASHADVQAGITSAEQQHNEDLHGEENKKVRGRTRKAAIFSRQNKPKLQLEINEHGQPCGKSCTEFSNFLGALIRTKGFPVAHNDWRKVGAREKYKLWTDSQLYWDLDRGIFDWFMTTAGNEWKEFKADLKAEFLEKYNDDMEEQELLALCDERVHEADWKWLINYWRSPEAIARSLRGKANRAKAIQNHTTGSKSHARISMEMREELGRPPRRHEVFIRSHTHKTGLPHKGSEATINALNEAVRDNPELAEKSMQEGDAYYHVCGPERNGYVRVVGCGPTPASLEMTGAKQYTSTKLQMEIEARRQADKKVEFLESRVYQLQETMDKLLEQLQNRNNTPNASNNEQDSRNRASDANQELDGREDDAGSYVRDDIEGNLSDYENVFMNKRVLQHEAQHVEGGRDVILYSVVRPYDSPVAKATIQTKNPNAIVAGTRLGVQFYEVVVNHVFARDAILPRPYGNVTNLGEACGRCIAWPCDRIKDDKKSLRNSGSGRRPS